MLWYGIFYIIHLYYAFLTPNIRDTLIYTIIILYTYIFEGCNMLIKHLHLFGNVVIIICRRSMITYHILFNKVHSKSISVNCILNNILY